VNLTRKSRSESRKLKDLEAAKETEDSHKDREKALKEEAEPKGRSFGNRSLLTVKRGNEGLN
jgi:hypothetical protein